jgi:hypothetical protein
VRRAHLWTAVVVVKETDPLRPALSLPVRGYKFYRRNTLQGLRFAQPSKWNPDGCGSWKLPEGHRRETDRQILFAGTCSVTNVTSISSLSSGLYRLANI